MSIYYAPSNLLIPFTRCPFSPPNNIWGKYYYFSQFTFSSLIYLTHQRLKASYPPDYICYSLYLPCGTYPRKVPILLLNILSVNLYCCPKSLPFCTKCSICTGISKYLLNGWCLLLLFLSVHFLYNNLLR